MFYMTPCCLGGCAIFFIKSFITSAASLTFFSCFVWKKICSYCEQHVYSFKTEFYKVQSSLFLYLPINLKAKSETIKENAGLKETKKPKISSWRWAFELHLSGYSEKNFLLHWPASRLSGAALHQNDCLGVCAEHIVLQAGHILSFSQQLSVSSSLPSRQSSSPSHFHRALMQRWLWHWNSSFLHGCGSEPPPEASVRDRRPSMKYLFWGGIISIAIIAPKLIIMSPDPVDDCWDRAHIS